MKQLFITLLMLTSFCVFAENPPSKKPTVENGHWEKKVVKGTRVNTTKEGQNVVIGFTCERPYVDECLHYYEWVADNPKGKKLVVGVTGFDDPSLPIPMDESKYYLGIQTGSGTRIYELHSLQLDTDSTDKISITIEPGISQP